MSSQDRRYRHYQTVAWRFGQAGTFSDRRAGCRRRDAGPGVGHRRHRRPRRPQARLAKTVSPEQRSEEHTSELQSLMRISYAVFCLKKKTKTLHVSTNMTAKK